LPIKVLKLVVLLLVLYVPGYAAWVALLGKKPDEDSESGFSLLFGQMGFGLAVGGALALVLALAGHFSIATWTGGCVAFSVVVLLASRPKVADALSCLPLKPRLYRRELVIGLILVLALANFALPFMNVFGQADETVYPNVAANITRTGSVFPVDKELSGLPMAQFKLFYRGPGLGDLVEPGFYIRDYGSGQLLPQFVFFYPALMAGFMAFLGDRGGYLILTLLAILSVLGVFLIGRELADRKAGALAALFMSVAFLQTYFAKYSTSEMAMQFFFILGLYAFIRYYRAANGEPPGSGARLYGVLAGLGFGCMMLAHVEAFFILFPMLLLFCFYFVDGGWKAVYRLRVFLLVFLATASVAIILAFGISYRYVGDNFHGALRAIPGQGVGLIGAVALVLVVAALLRGPLKGLYRLCLRKRRLICGIAAAGFVLLAVYAWFIRPQLSYELASIKVATYSASNVSRLAFYVTPIGVALIIAGYAFAFWRIDKKFLPPLVIGLFFSTIFIYRTFAMPVLVYSLRRFVPVALPVGYLLAACLITAPWRSYPDHRRRMEVAKVVLGLGAAAFIAWSCVMTAGITKLTQARGSLATVRAVSAAAPGDSVIVSDWPAGHLITTPLRSFFSRRAVVVWPDRNVDSQPFLDFLQANKKAGRPVYLVRFAQSNIAEAPHPFGLERVARVPFSGVFLASPTEKPSLETGPYNVYMDVYRVVY
jgi:4-amino-4-deoxy-L-arabinose transferase-like glycosyltransferase